MTRHPAFLKLWAASAMSDVGSQVSTLALPLIAALTLDATAWQMGLLSAAGSAPVLLVGLLTGVWVDRRRRQPVLIATDLGRAILLSTVPLASALGVLRIDLLYVVTLLVGTLTVLFGVAHMSFVPSLLERERLVEGNSKLEATTSVAQVAGPGLGGVLVGVLGAPLAVLVDALSFLGSALVIAKIRVSEASPVTAPGRAGVLAEIGEGLRVVRRQPILLVLAGCSATTALFGAMFLAVYVLYMTRDLGLGAAAIGLVFATGGLGALAGALGAAAAARRFGPGPAMLGAQLLFGLAGIAVPLAVLVPRVALALVVASEFAQWMTFVAYRVNALSVRQAITPDRLQGRVNATMRFLIGGAFPIGAVIGGALGGAIGVPLTLAVASLGTLLPCLWLLQSPVRRLRTLPMVEPAGPALAM
ncbi:MAG TPA: MFS transporter [Methylomirabilota bacterium]|nr:MFS transporter [Methylomirabilota bacterium]